MKNKNNKIKCFCKNCNEIFYEIPSKVNKGKGKFCSLKCYLIYRRKRIVVRGTSKTCSTCGIEKDIKDFMYRKDTRDRLTTQCSDCRKKTLIRSKYKVSIKEAKDLYYQQINGSCDACGMTADEHFKIYGNLLHIDHDHETGKVRGVICYKCNITLGHFKDSIEHLQLLINYLRRVHVK
jgi:hypothetical protein